MRSASAGIGANDAQEMLRMHAALKQASQKLSTGDLDGAAKISRKLLQRDPVYMGALQTLGVISLKKTDFHQAINCFATAAAEAPDDFRNFMNLGLAWYGLKKPEMAELYLREASRLNPNNAEVHRLLGQVAMEQRNYETAESALRTAMDNDPKNLDATIQLADCHAHLGNYEEAVKLLLKVHRKRPEWLAIINKLHRLPAELVDIDFVSAVAKTAPRTESEKPKFENTRQFLEAAILDRVGDHKRAWELMEQANKFMHQTKSESLQTATAKRAAQLEAAKAATIVTADRGVRRSNLAPLFIMGVSRSGKTTLETTLCAHPAIQREFESFKVRDASVRASQIGGLPNMRYLHELPEQLHGAFADNFYARLKPQDSSKRFATETSPGSIGSVPQLANALPNARFVFIKRNRDDLALRIFMSNYRIGNLFAYDLADIFQYIDWYETMIDVLLEKMDKRAIEVRYEELVEDAGAVANKVFDLCGLDGKGVSIDAIYNDIGAALPYKTQLDAARASIGQ